MDLRRCYGTRDTRTGHMLPRSRREAGGSRGLWLGWPALGEPEAVFSTFDRALAEALAARCMPLRCLGW